jgi:hypothetical protein
LHSKSVHVGILRYPTEPHATRSAHLGGRMGISRNFVAVAGHWPLVGRRQDMASAPKPEAGRSGDGSELPAPSTHGPLEPLTLCLGSSHDVPGHSLLYFYFSDILRG